VRIAIVNYVWRDGMTSPDDIVDRFPTLIGWAESVQAAGAEVAVYQRFPVDAQRDRHGVRYVFVRDGAAPNPSMWSSGAAKLHSLVAASRPDLAHVNGVLHPRRVRALRRALPGGTALVVQDHGGFIPGAANGIRRAWIARGLSAADALIVAAREQEPEWRAAGIVPRGLAVVDVMESSTTLEPIPRDEARRRSGVAGAPALLWVGRLTANKDPMTVLGGVEQFFHTHPDARLTLVYGSADLEPQVRAAVEASPVLSTRVRLVGAVPHGDLPAYYCAADMLVAGSRHEGSGYAVIEALACGAVPVLTDIPPFRALTDRGRVGRLWTVGDAGALAAALRATWDRVPRDRVTGRTLFDERFSWPAIGRRALHVYGEIGSARTARRS
jgi:glycosyltransferase involved in cell wall biosynthesis